MVHALHRIGLRAHRAVMRPFYTKPRLIIILSTMRSGTSLLTRVLSDNPQIYGYGESHVCYEDESAILDLKYWIYRFTRTYPGRNDYLLDKVLHKSHLPDIGELSRYAEIFPIFLIRNPAGNANSLERMFERGGLGTSGLPWEYLQMRYGELIEYTKFLEGRFPIAAYSYEKLTSTPDIVLDGLQNFLSLQDPLNAEYSTPSYLGRWGVGDGSSSIRSGKILERDTSAERLLEIEVPESVSDSWMKLKCRLMEAAREQCM